MISSTAHSSTAQVTSQPTDLNGEFLGKDHDEKNDRILVLESCVRSQHFTIAAPVLVLLPFSTRHVLDRLQGITHLQFTGKEK